MQQLFVYGTLEFPEVVRKILGATLDGEPALLQGFARYLLINRDYPGIVPDSASTVDGVLYHGVTPKYIKLLDRYEDNIYERRRVQVVTDKGQPVVAWAYVIPPRYRRELSANRWNRDIFKYKHLRRFLNVRCS